MDNEKYRPTEADHVVFIVVVATIVGGFLSGFSWVVH